MKSLPVGSKRLTHNGYVQVKTTLGQRRWPFEHRVVWEKINGPVPPGHCIHHRNGIRADNRYENLALCRSNSEHHRRFHLSDARARGRHVGLSGIGRPKSPEHRAKIAAALRGKSKTLEQRAAMSANRRGRTNPRLAAALRGRTLSAEHRANISAGLLRKKSPLQSRANRSSRATRE